MASVSSTSSLGNTSLRGFGGMVSGIDRDEIIEQMTLGTNTKITNAKSDITKLQWKQEAYRSLSDMIIGLSDDYGSFTSASSLVDPTLFAKSIITAHGSDKSKNYVTATGTSDLLDNVAISAVRQLATSTVLQSKEYTEGSLKTSLSDLGKSAFEITNLEGQTLTFGIHRGGEKGWETTVDFKFASKVQALDEKGDPAVDKNNEPIMEDVNYYANDTAGYEKLADQLNRLLKDTKLNDNKSLYDAVEFKYRSDTETIEIVNKKLPEFDEYRIKGDTYSAKSALKALGYKGPEGTAIDISQFNDNLNKITETAVTRLKVYEGLTDSYVTFNYNGSRKNVTMLTQEEADHIKNMTVDSEGITADSLGIKDLTEEDKLLAKATELGIDLDIEALSKRLYGRDENGNALGHATSEQIKQEIIDKSLAKKQMEVMINGVDGKGGLQSRLNQAFGTNNVVASLSDKGELQFKTTDTSSSVSIVGGSGTTLWNLGVSAGDSSKVNLNGKLGQDNIGIDLEKKVEVNGKDELYYKEGLVINGVTIGGITKDTSISDILSKINSSKAGVKATYVDATGQFMLVSSETGKGRQVNLDSQLAKDLFGNGKTVDGQDAIIDVSYGNGVNVTLNRASNTFNLEGLSVTVSGVFGGEWKEKEVTKDGVTTIEKVWEGNTADTVTFTAKADVDKATERVKSFIEAFNELATEVNTQLTSRPDKSYGPLTDEQKQEMDETSIENWEKKAKQGLLYSDSVIRDLSGDIQSVMVKLLNSGVNYQDLEKIGLTYSDDYKDGGKLIFDETKFRAAMESDPDLISDIFTGGGNVNKGLTKIVEETLTPYATRYASRNPNGRGGSYGRLIEEAGSEKAPSTLSNNFIYKQIEEMNTRIKELQSKLKTQQDRYIKQFSSMENLISQMNSQSSWLSQITG